MSKINRNYDLYVNLIMNLTLSLFVYCNFISFSVNAVNSDNQTETGEGTLVKSLGENSLREIGHLVNVYFQVVK